MWNLSGNIYNLEKSKINISNSNTPKHLGLLQTHSMSREQQMSNQWAGLTEERGNSQDEEQQGKSWLNLQFVLCCASGLHR